MRSPSLIYVSPFPRSLDVWLQPSCVPFRPADLKGREGICIYIHIMLDPPAPRFPPWPWAPPPMFMGGSPLVFSLCGSGFGASLCLVFCWGLGGSLSPLSPAVLQYGGVSGFLLLCHTLLHAPALSSYMSSYVLPPLAAHSGGTVAPNP